MALSTRVPDAALPTRVAVSADDSTSESLSSTLPDSTPSSATLNESAPAAGASFTEVTAMVTVAVPEFAVPSLTRYVKLSVPLKFGFGV